MCVPTVGRTKIKKPLRDDLSEVFVLMHLKDIQCIVSYRNSPGFSYLNSRGFSYRNSPGYFQVPIGNLIQLSMA